MEDAVDPLLEDEHNGNSDPLEFKKELQGGVRSI